MQTRHARKTKLFCGICGDIYSDAGSLFASRSSINGSYNSQCQRAASQCSEEGQAHSMAATTGAEMALIEKFRFELKGILDEERLANDDFLLRWLRARNHDLIKAKDMLVNHLKWFEEKNMAAIHILPRPAFFDLHFKHYYNDGVDKTGRPLCITPVGQWNIKELLRLTTPELIVHEFARVMEVMKGRVEAARTAGVGRGRGPNGQDTMVQMVGIGDFYGFGWQQGSSWPTIQRMLDIASTFEAHYPELVHTMYVINCPRLFLWVGSVLKRAFPVGTRDKLQFYGGKDEWWPMLSGMIDVKYLGMLHGVEKE